MAKLKSKPYKLFNKIQNYDWGTKNENAFIPSLLGVTPENDVPYAELWIGSHPKLPSEIEIDNKLYALNQIIEKYPLEFIGEDVALKYGFKLPFLLKALSAARALSIQTHPDKQQAVKLHAVDPENYPDDNHKPEIAITIDSLTAMAGFRPVKEIVANLKKNPELVEFAGKDLFDNILNESDEKILTGLIKTLYGKIMTEASNAKKLAKVIESITNRLSSTTDLSFEDEQFLKQYALYGNDVGLFSFFFFNIVKLKEGQAIFTGAGVPHAYIEGNIIECMANSDNVIRAGLTNKFKDVDTLLGIMDYSFSEFTILNKEQKTGEIVYKTPAKEFEVIAFTKTKGFSKTIQTKNKPSVILVTSGSLEVHWKDGETQYSENYKKGESFIIPAALPEYSLTSNEDTKFFLAEIP